MKLFSFKIQQKVLVDAEVKIVSFKFACEAA